MDINALRSQTPGTAHVIHFNNAGASLPTHEVMDAQHAYLEEESLMGGYETATRHQAALDNFYDEAAKLIGATREEIAYTESATVAWQRAFFSIPFQPGDKVLVSVNEYASNYISYLLAKEKYGVVIEVIPANENGELNCNKLEAAIDKNTRLISITHMPTNGGLVNPAEKIGAIAKKYNLLYLLDTCQSIGHYPLDINKIGCDFMTATGRKYLRGPRGTGFLYVRKKVQDILLPPNLDLHAATWVTADDYTVRSDARRFETWEHNPAAKLGLTIALQQANALGDESIWQRITSLADKLRAMLLTLPNVTVHDLGTQKSGIVTLSHKKLTPQQLQKQLAKKNINTSVTVSSGTLLDMQARQLPALLRVSVHYYNTTEEITQLAEAINV